MLKEALLQAFVQSAGRHPHSALELADFALSLAFEIYYEDARLTAVQIASRVQQFLSRLRR